MRRLLLLIFVLLLLVDLADDGFPGKVTVFSLSPLTCSVTSSDQYDPDIVDSWCEFSPTDSQGIRPQFQTQALIFSVLPILKIISPYHTDPEIRWIDEDDQNKILDQVRHPVYRAFSSS